MTTAERASQQQVGGEHYRNHPIQPAEFCQRNKLNWCESNVVKYVCRHAVKNGAQDIRKAIHYLELLLEWEYPETAPLPGTPRYKEIHTPLTESEVNAVAGAGAKVCTNSVCRHYSAMFAHKCKLYNSVTISGCLHMKPAPTTLCPSCQRNASMCHGEYPKTAEGGCEGYIKEAPNAAI